MKIAIIGRPNVGKSTLFNRLVGEKSAIVNDAPGVTRDRKMARAELCGLKFSLYDTPGIDPFSQDALALSMNEQSQMAVKDADLIFWVVDAIEGIRETDKAIADWIRRAVFKKAGNRPVILIRNKSEGKAAITNAKILGFGDGIATSAEHGLGLDEIYLELAKLEFKNEEQQISDDVPLKVAIVGRPNVGKSTLINAIVKEERLLTGDQPGITRDTIALEWKFKNRRIFLMDTAGQRRKSKIEESVEAVSVADAWKHIRQANVVVILMDIRNPLEKQDVTIARKVFEEGKIIIFALNKSDLADNPECILEFVQKRTEKEFAQLPAVSCLLVSAKEKKGLIRIFNTSVKLYDNWSRRISTGALNKWFQAAVGQNPPPLRNGMPIKLKYISQISCKPPTFSLFANRLEHLPKSYERYLLNQLRKSFNFDGVPLRLFLRSRENPYHKQ
ncbi:MAG: ribosome biogenesis GTPase Der [Holosporaceae bacterium]|jgi:GTP-binding protein|nr:ribosome biogenesis GTPase Der [Holosporaceae bacterium]